jgi:integrase
MLADSTLSDKAYALLPFFRFLQRNSMDFFGLTEENLTPFILLFRNELSYRARHAEEREGMSMKSSTSLARLSRTLTEVGFLCAWWGLVKPSKYQHDNNKGFFRNRRSRALPSCFNLAVPKWRRRFKQNHVLEPNEIQAIWDFLTSEMRPHQPHIVSTSPSGPKRGWPVQRVAAWKSAKEKYRERLAWFHRHQMLWALMVGSGMRRGEVTLIKLTDVEFHANDLWVCLRVRKDTAYLGRAKTGPRTIFIGWDSRIITAWQNWIRSREVLINKWVNAGNPRHDMFLTNRDGAPLTVEGLNSLFEGLNKRFRIFGGEFFEDQFRIHPHAVRHSVKSLFDEWDVPRHIKQRHLGHKKPETTDLYGKAFRKTYRDVLSRLETAVARRLSEKSA